MSEEKKILVISPQAGMCNRFRMVTSACAMARHFGYSIEHTWNGRESPKKGEPQHVTRIKGKRLCDFMVGIKESDDDVFEKQFDLVLTEWHPESLPWGPRQNDKTICDDLRVTRDPWQALASFGNSLPRRVLLQTSLVSENPAFGVPLNRRARGRYYRKHMRIVVPPQDFARSRTIGIHLRMGDLLKYRPDAAIGMDEVNRMIDCISGFGLNVVVVTNDSSFRNAFSGICTPSSNTPIQDWFTLANCGAIIGTPGSSFGLEAAVFSGAVYGEERTPAGAKALMEKMTSFWQCPWIARSHWR